MRDQNDMARKVKLRPSNYLELSPQQQWEVDLELGIISPDDWEEDTEVKSQTFE